jgi:hypothetical protein
MAEQQQTSPIAVPKALSQVIAVNAEFEVLPRMGGRHHSMVSFLA